MTGTVEDKLKSLGVSLPPAAKPAGSYVPVVQSGNLLFISGQIPMGPDGLQYIGKCGAGMSVEDAQAAAKMCALNILGQVKGAVGSLDKVARIVKLNGFVNSTPDFPDHPKVINGASDFFVEVFGEKGQHARAAVGVANLPFGVAVEVEAIVEITP
ncbi:RidA family protein [Acuticoccus sp. M5D2P5]|uniref:RidA family protein n=1 Tax=Acuticoccus kalidii TaxID=2910977 RepID=UPI001F2B7D5B|nr:RidA family protein [Acuticoccus kalidii]MCF3935760.1 RidA family protein [Acuticoccus kalidii]